MAADEREPTYSHHPTPGFPAHFLHRPMRWHFSSELPAGDDLAEYIQGQDLQALPKPVPWQFALELAVGLARGLAAAHKRGVLHRDIDPPHSPS